MPEPHPTTQDILTLTATSLSAAPNLTEAERTARFQTVVRGTIALQPTDTTQTILASLILAHHLTIMDAFRDIACLTLTPTEAARARMVTVAQTKLVLQLARELRAARKEAPAQTAPEPAPEPNRDTGFEAPLAELMSAYVETLAALANTDNLTPAAAAKARQALSEALPPPPSETNSPPGQAAGSRAQRRAMMKRQGKFKRAA